MRSTVAASAAYGCSLRRLRLQGFAKLNYPAAKLTPAITDALLKNNLVDGCKVRTRHVLPAVHCALRQPSTAATP